MPTQINSMNKSKNKKNENKNTKKSYSVKWINALIIMKNKL